MRPLSAIATAGVIAGPSYFIARRLQDMARVAPELRNPVLLIPFSVTNRPVLRALRAGTARATKPLPGVTVAERQVSVPEVLGGTVPRHGTVRIFTYEPDGRSAGGGALIWLHGGGRVSGSPVSDHRICSFLAQESGGLVVSVDYRLAPEHPFPAALEDICGVLTWLQHSVDEWGIDPARIAIGGASAGAGLAVEAAQWATDAGVDLAFQLLLYPMLDDRTVTPDPQGRGRFIWTAASNRFSWTAYLGHEAGGEEVRPYAVAARRDDLRGLPPAWIGVGELDLFYPEDMAYAERLTLAGVECQLDVVPGMYHAADLLPNQPQSMRTLWQRMADALREAIG